jgi:hypothetical protein
MRDANTAAIRKRQKAGSVVETRKITGCQRQAAGEPCGSQRGRVSRHDAHLVEADPHIDPMAFQVPAHDPLRFREGAFGSVPWCSR